MATFDDVQRIAASWPGVTVDTGYGTPVLKGGGKGFCRMWSEREHKREGVDDTEVLVVPIDLHEKVALIEASGGVLFSTPHYDSGGGALVRLADVDDEDLAGYLEDAYRQKATAPLLNQFEAN